MNVPPTCRAWRKLKSAVRAVPMWSGPVGLGAMRTRIWSRFVGSVIRRRDDLLGDLVEEGRIGLAGQDPDQGGRSQAERGPSARPVQRERVERFGAGEDRDVGAGHQRARLEVREQPGVLLGLLGDPVDRRPLTGRHLAEADAGRPALGRLGVDRVAVRARLGVPEHLVEARLHPRRDRALEAHRLVVRLGPAEADDLRQQPFEQGMPAEDAVRRGSAGRGQVQLATPGLGDEAVGDEPAEHLAGGLRGHAEVPRDLRGRDPTAVRGPGHHPQRQQVLLRGRRQVVGIVAGRHGLRIRDRRDPTAPRPVAAAGRAR